MRVLIVGAGAGGLAAAARLRRLDEKAEIVVFEKGPHASLSTSWLPYLVGGVVSEDELLLQTPESLRSRHALDVRVRTWVAAIDRAAKTIEVKYPLTHQFTNEPYDKLILATGAVPFKPWIPGLDSEGVMALSTLEDALAIREAVRRGARRAVVLGGGAMGVEMADNLHAAGLKVVIVEAADQIIPPLDFDMAAIVAGRLKGLGVGVLTGAAARLVKRTGDNLEIFVGHDKLIADLLILAMGVRPKSRLALMSSLKIDDDRGHIIVDERMMTSDPDIFAVGDAVGIENPVTRSPVWVAMAGPAQMQGRVAADAIAGLPRTYNSRFFERGQVRPYDGALGTGVIKAFDMIIAFTGPGEMVLRSKGRDFETSFTVSQSHVDWYPGSREMIVKTIFCPGSGGIFGAQLIGGEGVHKRCDVMATAIRHGAIASKLAVLDLACAPPFGVSKDPLNVAGQVAENIVARRSSIIQWSDVDGLDPDQATLLDVRTAGEFEAAPLPGFINIPFDELRGRLGDLDRGKPVMVASRVGALGYLAERILTLNGFNARNLSGGQLVYSAVMASKAT